MCNSCNKQKCNCDKHLNNNLLKQLITEYTAFNQFVLEFQDLLVGNVTKNWSSEESYPQDVVVTYKIGEHNYLFRAKKNNEGNVPSLEDNEFWEVLSAKMHEIDPDPHGVQNFTVEDGDTPYKKILTISRTDDTPLSILLDIPDTPSVTALPEIRYGGATTADEVPSLNINSREPAGWTIEPPATPFVWMTSAVISQEDDTLLKPWASPSRLTGLPGAPGQDGQDGQDGAPGQDGAIGDGVFKSQVFYVSETEPATPAGGSWLSPVPTTPGWSDGIPDLEGPRWMSTRIFTLSGAAPQQASWTQPKLLADSADVDIEFSSVLVNPGNPTDNPGNWSNDSDSTTEWMAIRKYANGEWGEWKISKIKGENGLDGNDGQDGQDGQDGKDGQDGTGYEFQYTVTNRGDSPPSISNDAIWSSTFPGAIDSSQTLWYRQRTVTGSSTGVWVGPIKLSGSDGESIEGPAMAYRGDWSAIQEYSGTSLVVDVVKYAGLGYIARTDAGEIPVGTLPTDTNYWNEFTENIDSLFTDFLFAYSAYIPNLVVGQVLTNANTNDSTSDVPDPLLASEGTAIGFSPIRSIDPTSDSSTFSRHGIRQYHPSGRISAYMGPVHNYEYTNSNGDTVLVDGWAIITFLDMEDSPVSFHLDSSTQNGIQFAQDVAFTPVSLIRVSSIDIEDDPTDTQMYSWIGQSRSNCAWYHDSLGLANYVGFFYEYAPHQVVYRKVQGSSVTYVTAPNTSAPTITDGWFIKSFYLAPPTPPVGGGLIYPFPRQGTMSLRKIKNGIEEPVSPSVSFHLSSSYPIDGARWVFSIRQGTIENPGPEIKSIDKLAQYKGSCSASGVNTTLYSLTYGEESPEHS